MSRWGNELRGYRPNREATGFAWAWILWILGFVVALVVIFGALGFVFGWFGAARDVVAPENVKAQFQAAYDDINALNAVAGNICIAVKQRDAYPKGSTGYDAGESNVVAQEQNYQRIQNHYNAYIHDPFRAKLVRPRDLPDPAPTEAEAIAALPNGGCAP